MPLVAPIEDTNGDGRLSELDTTGVFFVGHVAETGDERLISLESATGTVRWISDQPADQVVYAIADIDNDDVNDVVSMTGIYGALALRASDGRMVWTSNAEERWWTEIADLTGDGDAELVSPPYVADGESGAVEFALPETALLDVPVVADIDLDGAQEILVDGIVYDAQGDPQWRAPGAERYGWTEGVPLQLDDDPEAELLWLGWDELSVTEHDGTVLGGQSHHDDEGWLSTRPPCAGDFDGDGAPDIAFGHSGGLRAQTALGTLLWEAGLTGVDTSTYCSVFDFNGDGLQDVVLANGARVSIFSGLDGEEHVISETIGARDGVRWASVVDLDRDGHAELLTFEPAESGGFLHAYGHAGEGWPPAGPTWTSHSFAGTNGNPGGHVPRSPVPTWLSSNTWRGRTAAEAELLADLQVAAQLCTRSGLVRTLLENRGGQAIAGVVLELLADGVKIDEVEVGLVEGGSLVDGITLDPQGHENLVVKVTASDPSEECDTETTRARLESS
ncbi:hypothetical protein LBMAG42_16810 [Deltaproteobacteria bacterium]|nr:hypothetical protein LBMAG42_16810 [Deltaproteobacteria bacterium]